MIPARLLPQALTFTEYLGSGPNGPRYGDDVTIPARIVPERKTVIDASGSESVSSATAYIQPTNMPNVGALVTLPDGSRRKVMDRQEFVGASVVEVVTLLIG